jgi:hypothetical protein
MTKYTVVPHSDALTFNIAIVGEDGARQTMLGFKSKAEAEAWIVADQRRGGLRVATDSIA